MALAWPSMSPGLVSEWWRQAVLTGRTGAGRARPGPLDAVSATRAAQPGRAAGALKGRDGSVEAIRALMGRRAQRPRRADPDQRPGQVPDCDRAR
jgi:hypothetical protein